MRGRIDLVKLRELSAKSGEERRIRETCVSGDTIITVYEPSKVEIDRIVELQSEFVKYDENDEAHIVVGEELMLRKLVPLLTSVEIPDDITDEEIRDILDNPSLALLMMSKVIETILIEVYKITVLSAKAEIERAEFSFESERLETLATQRALAAMGRMGGMDELEELSDKIKKANDNLDELEIQHAYSKLAETEEALALEEEENAKLEKQAEEKNKVAMNINPSEAKEDINDILSRYKEAFGDKL